MLPFRTTKPSAVCLADASTVSASEEKLYLLRCSICGIFGNRSGLIKRNEYLMTERTHNELGIVHELLKLALFLLRDMSGGRIISVLYGVSIGFDRKIAELVLKIAYLGRTEGVVGSGEHHSFRPVVLIWIPLMLHKAVEYSLAVLPDSCLSYVSDVLSGVIRNAKKEINAAPF